MALLLAIRAEKARQRTIRLALEVGWAALACAREGFVCEGA
jgi:hypothetical protein